MRTGKKIFHTTTAALLLSVVLTGCAPTLNIPTDLNTNATPSPETGKNTTTPETPPRPASDETFQAGTETSTKNLLSTLTVTDETYADSYNRDLFTHWHDAGQCDTRDTVLLDESTTTATGCDLNGGTWTSVYDNITTTNASEFDIDHMVPLKEAWRSGAAAWDDATREAYANDLGYENSLIAVSATSNRTKSDQDPANWVPTKMDTCQYVSYWVAVKYRWSLTVNAAENQTITHILDGCQNYTVAVPQQAPTTAGQTPDSEEPDTTTPPVNDENTDPKYDSCAEANKNGYGNYTKGEDTEYDWYRDGDGDGTVCE